ncbi:hypothetical protein CR513_24919, partial [Mucuna pruriens]
MDARLLSFEEKGLKTGNNPLPTKARSRIIHNILSQTEQEAPNQDDDFVGLQVVLHIDLDAINNSLSNIHDGGEEVDRQLLDQIDFDEPNEDGYITTVSEIESDFNDINTFEMTDKGTSDDRIPPNRGRSCVVGGRGQPTINSPTSTIHISMSESTIPILPLLMVQEEP